MFKRELDAYKTDEHRRLYTELIESGEGLFKTEFIKPTIFHQMLIDRVVDAYITTLKVDGEQTFSEKKFKASQDKLQRWLNMTFTELHSAKKELAVRQRFYERCIHIFEEMVPDTSLRRDIFVRLRDAVDEGGKL